MKNKKEYMIVLYTILALMINLCGRTLADKLALPIWCDSIGTFLMAYFAGPVCGAVVGFTGIIVYGTFVGQKLIYCIVGALLGAIVGYFAKKKVFETQFATMTFGMGLAVFFYYCCSDHQYRNVRREKWKCMGRPGNAIMYR